MWNKHVSNTRDEKRGKEWGRHTNSDKRAEWWGFRQERAGWRECIGVGKRSAAIPSGGGLRGRSSPRSRKVEEKSI
jgi:hypothetical protein